VLDHHFDTLCIKASSCISANPWQLIADQHVDNAPPAKGGVHHNAAWRLTRNVADDRCPRPSGWPRRD